MKEFLFSRSHKKHYSNAVVRMGKNNLGFSLVELIIVIAIMAILVAVAIPVIGVFIERSKVANDKQIVSDVMYAIDLGGQSMQYEFSQDQIGNSNTLKVPIGIIILGDKEGITVIGSTAQNKASIEAVLEDTLGSTYSSNMALKYDGWAGATYASFFSSADEMMDKVEATGASTLKFLTDINSNGICSLAGVKYDDNGNVKAYKSLLGRELYNKTIPIISRGYANADELTYYMSQAVANVDRDIFINKWVNLTTEGQESFGLTALPDANNATAREYYSGVRAAYSQCFANYVSMHSTETHENVADHISDITGWGESGSDLLASKMPSGVGNIAAAITGAGDVTFPWAVCGETFEHENSSATNDDFVDCAECESLWYEYYQSEQAKADAAAFYDTMAAGASYNSGDADAPYAGMIDWAKNETDTFTSLYDSATEEINKNDISIMITVYKDPETGLIYGECNTPGVLDE